MKEWWEFEENLTSEYAHNEVTILKNTSIKYTKKFEKFYLDVKINFRSVAKNAGKNKENQDAKISIELNNNTTIDGLKQIEDELLNFHSMIDKMNDGLKEKR